MKRKKPEGEPLVEWCTRWDELGHDAKIKFCEDVWGISYETGRHWRSDSNIPKKENLGIEEFNEDTLTSGMISEVMSWEPHVHLDFVTFDIETTNLTADFSILLTACIKPYGSAPIVFRADDYPKWRKNYLENDSLLASDIITELKKHAIIITHYGSRFDMPYMRAKAMRYKINPMPQMFGIDTWSVARSNFKLASRRLQALSNYFEMGSKSQVEGNLWMKAAYDGDRDSMNSIVAHNIQDCIILEKLAAASFPYMRSVKKI